MEGVRPRARDDVHDGARIVAMRRAVVRRLNRKLLECVGEREALVFLEIRVGVVRAVQPVRVLALAGAVGRNADRARDRLAGLFADRRQHGARDQRLQPCHFAAGDRQLDDARVVDDLADGRRGDVDGGRLAGDRDRFRQVTQLEGDVHRQILVRLQGNVRAAHGFEARQLSANLIRRRANRWERVAPIGARDRVGPDTRCAFDGRHGCARNDAAGAVRQRSVDLTRALGEGRAWREGGQTDREDCQNDCADAGSHRYTSLVRLMRKLVVRGCDCCERERVVPAVRPKSARGTTRRNTITPSKKRLRAVRNDVRDLGL